MKFAKVIQSVAGSFLYYARYIDNTLLLKLIKLVSQQAQHTTATMEKAQQKIDYTSTYPNICYYASDMILHLDSDAVYLVAPQKPEVVL